MAQVAYQEVIKLVDQLTPDEKQALIMHLQRQPESQTLSYDAWRTLLDSIIIHVEPGANFSDRREDWYDDNGR